MWQPHFALCFCSSIYSCVMRWQCACIRLAFVLAFFFFCVILTVDKHATSDATHSFAVHNAQQWQWCLELDHLHTVHPVTWLRLTLAWFPIRSENESIPAFAHAWISSAHKLLLTAVFPVSTGVQLCRSNQEGNNGENESAPLFIRGYYSSGGSSPSHSLFVCGYVWFLCRHSLSRLNKYYLIVC